jgi:ADP-ribose pyrophosphatase YjhB (NUDIX family)
VLYVVHRDRLLVFREPDFPDVLPQVHGGRSGADEDFSAAARRKLAESTGLIGA